MVPGKRAYLEKESVPMLKDVEVHLGRSCANRSPTLPNLIGHFMDYFTAKTV